MEGSVGKVLRFFFLPAIALATAGFFLFSLSSPIHAWDPAWKYQMKLSFRNGNRTENLVNFPILVHLTSKNFDFSQAKTGGEDIRFVDSKVKTKQGTSLNQPPSF